MLRKALAVAVVTVVLAPVGIGPAGAATTLTVDTFTDTFDGSCSDGDCSLRDAVASAGYLGTVLVPGGSYALSTPEAGGPGDGSVVITDSLTIRGDGDTGAFIDASALGATPFEVGHAADVRFEDLTLLGASTDDRAGIVQVRTGGIDFKGVTLTGGRARLAGAVWIGPGGRLRMTDTLVFDNRSSDGAGAIASLAYAVFLIDSAFLANRGERGGAIRGSVGILSNVTIARNQARQRGGGLRTEGSSDWSNVTITRNRAPVGAAWSLKGPQNGALPRARHLVIDGNVSERGGQCDGFVVSVGRNVGSGIGCGFTQPTDRRRTDARLGPVTSNGGPTPTAALRPGSAAIDIGGGCVAADQRGAPREGRCDAGAYERVRCLGRAVDIVGTPGDDELSGGRHPDTFLGLGGDDEFQGSLGRDRACGGGGGDHLLGGPGDDDLFGGPGGDLLDGEAGADRCRGGRGDDELIACEA